MHEYVIRKIIFPYYVNNLVKYFSQTLYCVNW